MTGFLPAIRLQILTVCLVLAGPVAHAGPGIAIIIDDLGNLRSATDRTVRRDGPVACAILPYTPLAQYVARSAHRAGKEVLLHLPLEPVGDDRTVGVGVIDISSTRRQLGEILDADLKSIPYLDGVNNHMGSLLTRHPGHMAWLMSELRRRGGLFFVDSYTTPASVALQMAREAGIPATRIDVFLDTDPNTDAIAREFERLKALARKHGHAVAIGHPYDETLRYLEKALPQLRGEGIELVSVADVIHSQNNGAEMAAVRKSQSR